MIVEQFRGAPGTKLDGTSVSTFDRAAKRWKQTWVDNTGGYLDFVGGEDAGDATFEREFEKDGKKVRQRMVFRDVKADSLKWLWQRSDDGGKSWKTDLGDRLQEGEGVGRSDVRARLAFRGAAAGKVDRHPGHAGVTVGWVPGNSRPGNPRQASNFHPSEDEGAGAFSSATLACQGWRSHSPPPPFALRGCGVEYSSGYSVRGSPAPDPAWRFRSETGKPGCELR